jgi:hypothetical protein
MIQFGKRIIDQINHLSAERLSLYSQATNRPLTAEERKRLMEINRKLEELWRVRREELNWRQDSLDMLIDHSYRKAA